MASDDLPSLQRGPPRNDPGCLSVPVLLAVLPIATDGCKARLKRRTWALNALRAVDDLS